MALVTIIQYNKPFQFYVPPPSFTLVRISKPSGGSYSLGSLYKPSLPLSATECHSHTNLCCEPRVFRKINAQISPGKNCVVLLLWHHGGALTLGSNVKSLTARLPFEFCRRRSFFPRPEGDHRLASRCWVTGLKSRQSKPSTLVKCGTTLGFGGGGTESPAANGGGQPAGVGRAAREGRVPPPRRCVSTPPPQHRLKQNSRTFSAEGDF